DPVLQPAPRSAAGTHRLGPGARRILDERGRGHAEALLRPLLHQAHVRAVRSSHPLRHGEVRPQREAARMTNTKHFHTFGSRAPIACAALAPAVPARRETAPRRFGTSLANHQGRSSLRFPASTPPRPSPPPPAAETPPPPPPP